MTEQELNEKITYLTLEYNGSVTALKKAFAVSNNPYKIGDIIKDNICKIQIKTASILLSNLPQIVFSGTIIHKSGKLGKATRFIYQQNIIK